MNDDLQFALSLCDAADAITLERFRSLDLRWEAKPDRTPVSEADRAAEEAIRALVEQSGRGEGVLGEEFGDDESAKRWIVDPIDGTANYVRGVPIWATLIALEVEGEVTVGVASAPALGRRWWAARGKGAFADGKPIRVSSIAGLEDAAVSTTSVRRMPTGWLEVIRCCWSERNLGDFWQYCLLAEGAVDVATDAQMQPWDYAAPKLIVEEAGGRLSTFTGAEPSVGSSTLATNGLLHDEVIAHLS